MGQVKLIRYKYKKMKSVHLNKEGKITEINKYNYLSDKQFYEKILEIKGIEIKNDKKQNHNSNAIQNLLK